MMTRSSSFHNQPRLVKMTWLAWLCALCLLGMQGLGQMHGIAHGGSLQTTLTTTLSSAATDSVKVSDGWGHHSGDADCHVFDHLSHDQFLASQTALDCAAVAHLQPTTPIWAGAELAARWKRGARAPPLSA